MSNETLPPKPTEEQIEITVRHALRDKEITMPSAKINAGDLAAVAFKIENNEAIFRHAEELAVLIHNERNILLGNVQKIIYGDQAKELYTVQNQAGWKAPVSAQYKIFGISTGDVATQLHFEALEKAAQTIVQNHYAEFSGPQKA